MSRTPEDAAWAVLVALGDPYSRKSSTLVEHFAAYAEEVRAEAKAEALAEFEWETTNAPRPGPDGRAIFTRYWRRVGPWEPQP